MVSTSGIGDLTSTAVTRVTGNKSTETAWKNGLVRIHSANAR